MGRFYHLFNHFSSGQEKLGLESLCFHPKIMKNISKCSQNNVVSNATSIFRYYVPDLFLIRVKLIPAYSFQCKPL